MIKLLDKIGVFFLALVGAIVLLAKLWESNRVGFYVLLGGAIALLGRRFLLAVESGFNRDPKIESIGAEPPGGPPR